MSFVSRAHGTTWFISRRNRSRRVIFFLDSKAREAKVVCFILVLLMPVRAVVSAHWTGGLVQSFPNGFSPASTGHRSGRCEHSIRGRSQTADRKGGSDILRMPGLSSPSRQDEPRVVPHAGRPRAPDGTRRRPPIHRAG